MKRLVIKLLRTKTKTHLQKYECQQGHAPIQFLYVAREDDERLGAPRSIVITVEPATESDAASDAIRGEGNGNGNTQ